jgi:hypothetical protein
VGDIEILIEVSFAHVKIPKAAITAALELMNEAGVKR